MPGRVADIDDVRPGFDKRTECRLQVDWRLCETNAVAGVEIAAVETGTLCIRRQWILIRLSLVCANVVPK